MLNKFKKGVRVRLRERPADNSVSFKLSVRFRESKMLKKFIVCVLVRLREFSVGVSLSFKFVRPFKNF